MAEKRENDRHAVESRLLEDSANPAEEAAVRAVLGSEGFVDRMRRAMNDINENVNVRRESAQLRNLQSWCSLDDVIRAVERVCGVPEKELGRKSNRGFGARQILLSLAVVKCRGRYSLTDLSEQLGPLTISGLDSARSKMMSRRQKDKQLRTRVAEIESALDNKIKSEDLYLTCTVSGRVEASPFLGGEARLDSSRTVQEGGGPGEDDLTSSKKRPPYL